MDKNSGREKHVVGGGKGVQKRGSGLGTGPVGRSDGYEGRKAQYSGAGSSGSQGQGGGRPQRSGGSRSPIGLGLIVVVILLFIVFGRGCLGGESTQTSYSNTPVTTPQTQTQQTPKPAQTQTQTQTAQTQTANDLFGMLTGYTGNNNVSTGWNTSGNNTNTDLNYDVAEGSRDKRTQIIGNGEDTVTIMVYMCGADLESKSGMASRDIQEMCSASLSDKVNILIYTGGSKQWKIQGISNTVNQIYRVNGNGLERLVADDGSKVMTDPATLTGFIKWCAANFPANRNELIFWDHGSGSLSGYGYDEKNPRAGSMSLAGINKALSDSGMTFDFIGFDTCLMATLENGLIASKYADYLVASEETEPGIGWYYTDWLNALSANTSQPTVEIGKNIIDSFVDKCAVSCQGQKATLSIVDLAELQNTVPSKLTAFSESTGELIRSDNYQQVSNARADTREFAASSKIDQIDLVDFADNIGTPEAKELSAALLNAVKYNRTSSNMTNAYGLSIYFPYNRTSKLDSMTSIYEQIGMDSEYSECIRSFAGLETAGQISAGGTTSPMGSLFGMTDAYSTTSGTDAIAALLQAYLSGGRSVNGIDRSTTGFMNDDAAFDTQYAAGYIAANQFDPYEMEWYVNEEGQHVMALSDESWAKIQSLQINMFYDDGEGFIDLGLDSTWEFTEDGRLIGDTDDTWLSIDGQPVAYYYEGTIINGDQKTTFGRVPALLNGDRVNLILIFDNAHPYGYIAGAAYVYTEGETETVPKAIDAIEEGAQIDFIADYYSYDSTYEDTYLLGAESWTYHSDCEIGNTYVGEDTQITFLLTDFYNNEYWTPIVPKN